MSSNILNIDFKARKQTMDNHKSAFSDLETKVKLAELSLNSQIKSVLYMLLSECQSILESLEAFEEGKEPMSLLEFYQEAIDYRLDYIAGVQDKIFEVRHKADLLEEKLMKLHNPDVI